MLNKPSILLLGLVNQKPNTPYNLVKICKRTGFIRSVKESTIYNYMVKLCENGLVEKKDNLYYITNDGVKELKNTITEVTINFNQDLSYFTFVEVFLDIFENDESIEILKKREESIIMAINECTHRISDVKKIKVLPPFHVKCLERQLCIFKAELEGTRLLLDSFINDNNEKGFAFE